MSTYEPQWLVLGVGSDDRHRKSLLDASLLMSAEVHVAVLGSRDDRMASDRWLRRGGHVYLPVDSSVDRVLKILMFCEQAGVIIVDKCFQHLPVQHRLRPVTSLTRREIEVLSCVRLGRRNHEIASELRVSVSTVDFHIRNLLAKLGARNRVEAVRRADALGL